MAQVFSKKCSICGFGALRRDSVVINPASSTKRYIVCSKCGKPLNNFLKKHNLLKMIKPTAIGPQKERKLKTKKGR